MLIKMVQTCYLKKQVGNGIGSIIASIGIPMILDAIRGKGVAQAARPASGKRVGRGGPRMGKASGGGGPRIGMPMAPPPFIGTSGRGKKNRPEK